MSTQDIAAARADDLRARLHAMWAGVADAWEQHADYIDTHAGQMTARMLELTAPRPGERVLELACGAGGLGQAAAERVSPGGEVVLSDVAAEMTEIALRRSDTRGLGNVKARPLDLEQIDEPDCRYDVVLCREGLMLTPDPARAAREVHRVLRPGGRVAISVWGPRALNPWLGVLLDALSEQLGRPVPPPGVPGPFALSDADRLRDMLEDSGLRDVSVEQLDVPRRAASFDEWWRRTSALAGPAATIIESLPPEARGRIKEQAESATRPYTDALGGLELPGLALVAAGRRSPTTGEGSTPAG